METPTSDARRSELGAFLRSRREKLTPKAVGLPPGQRRRTAGLRREEVALLAGIGIDWYIRLEQGRTVTPSAVTVDALARALRLSKVEHRHLRALAQSGSRPAFARESVPDTVRRVVDTLNLPAYVTGRRWDVLAWNTPANELFGFDRLAETDRNTLLNMFANPRTKRLFGASWAGEAQRMVALFRATYDLWAGDAAFNDLLQRLRATGDDFTRWWTTHDVRGATAGQKELSHPKTGVRRFAYASFQCNDDPSLRLSIYTPL